jgi:hypothetical protein
MARQEFSKATKLAAFERCKGVCECGCGQKILSAEYDHWPVPAAFGGTNDLANCRVLNKRCHRKITSTSDVPKIAKATRIIEKRAGLRKSKRPFPKRVNAWNS